jgi:hypothetical protein
MAAGLDVPPGAAPSPSKTQTTGSIPQIAPAIDLDGRTFVFLGQVPLREGRAGETLRAETALLRFYPVRDPGEVGVLTVVGPEGRCMREPARVRNVRVEPHGQSQSGPRAYRVAELKGCAGAPGARRLALRGARPKTRFEQIRPPWLREQPQVRARLASVGLAATSADAVRAARVGVLDVIETWQDPQPAVGCVPGRSSVHVARRGRSLARYTHRTLTGAVTVGQQRLLVLEGPLGALDVIGMGGSGGPDRVLSTQWPVPARWCGC